MAFTNEEIRNVILTGSNFVDGKLRIQKFFITNNSKKDRIDFLRNEYGIGGVSPAYYDADFSQQHDSKGISLKRKKSEDALTITWSEVEKIIAELVKTDNYLNDTEKTKYQKELKKDVEYDYKIGDTVLICAEKFEIMEIRDDKVILYDYNHPLFTREYDKEAFNIKWLENKRNRD